MKLRIRSTETKETLRIETHDPSSLHDLKTLISAQVSSSSIPPESIRLSLNRKDELLPPSPNDSLQSLGLASGDLLFFSLSAATALTPNPPAKALDSDTHPPTDAMDETPETLDSNPHGEIGNPQPATSPVLRRNSDAQTLDSQQLPDQQEGTSSAPQGYLMDVDLDSPTIKSPPSVPCYLKRVMEAEEGEVKDDLGRLVVAVHAVFLESGFVACCGDGSRLPQGWASATPLLSVQYSVPDLVGPLHGRDVKVAILKFSAMGNYVSVYGFVSGDRPDVHRVCLDVPKLAPSLVSSMDTMGEKEEKDVFQLWKTLKDGLALPLLIDICEKNGLPLPPCFARLPTELKIMILEFLPGVDIARVSGTSSELRYLSSDGELWKHKFKDEFGLLDKRGIIGSSWRDKFARCWVKQKNANKRRTERGSIFGMPRNYPPRYNPFAPQRFPILGGDYDLLPAGPAGGGFGPRLPRTGFPHLPARRIFSPHCSLGGQDADFSM